MPQSQACPSDVNKATKNKAMASHSKAKGLGWQGQG